MMPIETTPGIGGEGIKKSTGWGEVKYHISDILY
jgi:hypothetical protein